MKTKNGVLLALTLLGCVIVCKPLFGEAVQGTYDNLSRIIKEEQQNGTTIEYTYDAAGNRTSRVVTAPSIETEVTSSTTVTFSNAIFDRRTGEYTGNLTVKNNSTQAYSGPITVVFKSITPSSVYVVNPETQWVDPNNPGVTYPAFVWNETLAPGAMSTIKKVRFYNPQRARMSYTSQAWAVVGANE